MARKRQWDDDDGRTIASMSDIERPNMFIPRKRNSSAEQQSQRVHDESDENSARPWEQQDQLSRKERGWYALGALRAALLIGLAFIVGLGAVILLLLLLWG